MKAKVLLVRDCSTGPNEVNISIRSMTRGRAKMIIWSAQGVGQICNSFDEFIVVINRIRKDHEHERRLL